VPTQLRVCRAGQSPVTPAARTPGGRGACLASRNADAISGVRGGGSVGGGRPSLRPPRQPIAPGDRQDSTSCLVRVPAPRLKALGAGTS